jgi:hypothetical protein
MANVPVIRKSKKIYKAKLVSRNNVYLKDRVIAMMYNGSAVVTEIISTRELIMILAGRG